MYHATTRSIRVLVEPFYLADRSEPERKRWMFGYKVAIENQGTQQVQLLSRYWQITDGTGRVAEVRGEGVVGEQPTLGPGERFEYTSGCPLGTPTGFMSGTYTMLTEHGESFEVVIPAFSLDAPDARKTLN